MKTLVKFALHFCFCAFFLLLSAFVTAPKITIFMIGDSTMANKKLDDGNVERGWGQMLPAFFSNDVKVDNHAVNGRSTKSFINEGRWDSVINKVKTGDYVFIQFGHNDEKPDTARHTDVGSTFDTNIKRFISQTRDKGGIPVLFTSIVRRKFNADGTLDDTHGAYVTQIRNIAAETGVTLVDMNEISKTFVQTLGDEKSKEMFMWVEKGKYAFYPEGKQDDTHLNVKGARTLAGITVDEIAKAVPALAPYVRHYDFTVAKDGSGDFFTVQEAVNSVPDYRKARTTIHIRKGIYVEKLIIPQAKQNIALIGDDGTTISGNDYAKKINAFGEEMGTSGSSSCYIYGNDFYAENITFENTAGEVGQAVAILVDGDRCTFKNCRFIGNQDTLYTYGKYRKSRQYYENCYIEGTTDFIFGWATAVFNNCVIHSKSNSYITAAATNKGDKYGYLFYKCKITAANDVSKCYLGRPWRPFAKIVFYECELGKHILPAGWHNWNKPEAEKNTFYAEYKCTGAGANTSSRVKWEKQLSASQAKTYTMQNALAGDDEWNPMK